MNKNTRHIWYGNTSIYLDISFEKVEDFLHENIEIVLVWDIYTGKERLINTLKNNPHNIEDISAALENVEWKFIIIRKLHDSVMIINDKIWLKPLYINASGSHIYASNTLETYILNVENTLPDKKNIVEFLEFWFLGWCKTLLQDVKNMQAGSIYQFGTKDKNSYFQYYSLSKIKEGSDTQKVHNSFRESVKRRVLDSNHIMSDLTWWYDSRLILGNLLALWFTQNINLYCSSNYSREDIQTSTKIWASLGIKIIDIDKQESINNKKQKQYYKFKIVPDKWSRFTWLCWWEILWNSMMDSWFHKNQVSKFIRRKELLTNKEYERNIPNFVLEICRSSINTVQWSGWCNPTLYGMWQNLLPFLDTNFLENIISIQRKDIKAYKMYKEIYSRYYPELQKFDFTYCSERDGTSEKQGISESDSIGTKNYEISKLEMKQIFQICRSLYTKHRIYLDTFIHEDIIRKIPLEMLIVLIYLEKINKWKSNIWGTV